MSASPSGLISSGKAILTARYFCLRVCTASELPPCISLVLKLCRSKQYRQLFPDISEIKENQLTWISYAQSGMIPFEYASRTLAPAIIKGREATYESKLARYFE